VKEIKDKKCKVCKEPFKPYSSLTQVCSVKCAVQYSKDKIWKQEKKELVLKLQTTSDLKKIAKILFQKWIRLRDKGTNCISCQANTVLMDGSHYFSAGSYSHMIFDENNCHASCQQCNRFLHGNLIEYRKGLVKRYGEGFVLDLEKRAETKKEYKYTQFELRNIINHYKAKIKEYERNDKTSH